MLVKDKPGVYAARPRSMRKRKSFWLLIPLGLLGCGEPAPKREWTPSDHGQPLQAPPQRDPSAAEVSDEDATARAARALFIATCAGCHGRDGIGDGEARPPGAQLPDFSSAAFQRSRSDQQLAQMIRDGRGMMPGFGKRVNDQGIAVLVQYIRSLAASAAAATP
jgi:mono/diheme cytochrome c family protein